MPKKWTEYAARDWLRFRPLFHALKSARYRRIDRRFLKMAKPDFEHLGHAWLDGLSGRNLIMTVAFNDPEAIHIQSKALQSFIPEALYLVVDNSNNIQHRLAIAEYCQQNFIPYIAVPKNPWTGRNPSRSHGFAMNWAWRYVVLPGHPERFGFIDHDLFPTRQCDPFRELDEHICCGDKRYASNRWFLWAGYCFFRFRDVVKFPLDFGLDWFAGLDTGGANWEVLYQLIDEASVKQRDIRKLPVWPGVSIEDAYFEWRGDWLHEVGLDGRADLRARKREAVVTLLAFVAGAWKPRPCFFEAA